jgi:hypothetical protein
MHQPKPSPPGALPILGYFTGTLAHKCRGCVQRHPPAPSVPSHTNTGGGSPSRVVAQPLWSVTFVQANWPCTWPRPCGVAVPHHLALGLEPQIVGALQHAPSILPQPPWRHSGRDGLAPTPVLDDNDDPMPAAPLHRSEPLTTCAACPPLSGGGGGDDGDDFGTLAANDNNPMPATPLH